MVKISFITFRDLIDILKQKSLQEIFFGKKVFLSPTEKKLLLKIKKNPLWFAQASGRKGKFIKKDLLHKGKGTVYLLPTGNKESILLFDEKTIIQSGPDLYVYLSTTTKNTDILNLGLLKGTQGGQVYKIKKSMNELSKYNYVLIYCKKFEVLFTYAALK